VEKKKEESADRVVEAEFSQSGEGGPGRSSRR
jgi:hypothetical protein